MLNVNPEVPTCPDPFDPETSYELKIDTNGDFEAEMDSRISLFGISIYGIKGFEVGSPCCR